MLIKRPSKLPRAMRYFLANPIFFLSGFFLTNIHNAQDAGVGKGYLLNFSPTTSTHFIDP